MKKKGAEGNLNLLDSECNSCELKEDCCKMIIGIRKVYKFREFSNFEMFPSDPLGSLDVFPFNFSDFGRMFNG